VYTAARPLTDYLESRRGPEECDRIEPGASALAMTGSMTGKLRRPRVCPFCRMGLIGATCRVIWYALSVIPGRPFVTSRPAPSSSARFLAAARFGPRRGRVSQPESCAVRCWRPSARTAARLLADLFRVAQVSQSDPCIRLSSDPMGRQARPWAQTHDWRRCHGARPNSPSHRAKPIEESPTILPHHLDIITPLARKPITPSANLRLFSLNLQPRDYQRDTKIRIL
jgi:hypothetical protein